MASWTFLTPHGLVLLSIARHPGTSAREIGAEVGISERNVQRLVRELAEAGYLEKERDGRRNRYAIGFDRPLPHRTTSGWTLGQLLGALVDVPAGRDMVEAE